MEYYNDAEADTVICTLEYTDCSNMGGYDPRDPCNHTCNWVDYPEGAECIQDYVIDCSYRGGYDPSDPCNLTCMDDDIVVCTM